MNPWKENNDRRPTYRSNEARDNLNGLRDILNTVDSLLKVRLRLNYRQREEFREGLELNITEGTFENYYRDQIETIREVEGDDYAEQARNIIKERR